MILIKMKVSQYNQFIIDYEKNNHSLSHGLSHYQEEITRSMRTLRGSF